MRKKAILGFVILVVMIGTTAGRIITVDDDGPADFNNIQDAINASWDGDTVIVKAGTYREGVYFNGRAITLRSTDPNNFDVVEATKLGGVTFDFGEGRDSVVSGFLVTGMRCLGASPTIAKNIMRPGHIFGHNGARPVIYANIIEYGGTAVEGCDGPIKYNKISHNESDGYDGAGLHDCDGHIHHNLITGNYAAVQGGGLCDCDGVISNNTIVGNLARQKGGGLYECNAELRNNIIAFNRAGGTAGIYGSYTGGFNDIWMNTDHAGLQDNLGGGATPGLGDVSVDPAFAVNGLWETYGTPDDIFDDVWVDGDYHLLSQAGRRDANSQSWVLDNWTSRCIDGGDPCEAIGVEPNPNGGRINMGAYGGTSEASKSPSGVIEPVCTKYPTMDFNRDCKVDFKDFAPMAENWLECNLDPPEACWE